MKCVLDDIFVVVDWLFNNAVVALKVLKCVVCFRKQLLHRSNCCTTAYFTCDVIVQFSSYEDVISTTGVKIVRVNPLSLIVRI